MSKVALADVLWDAANLHLWSGHESEPVDNDTTLRNPLKPRREYSCDAVGQCDDGWTSPSIEFLRSLGVSVLCTAQFSEYVRGTDRQGARYMWLLLAMHVAESEGIEIDIEDRA